MSFDALAWAAKQNPGSSGTKLVLLGLAECADRSHSLAFPSIAALVEFTCLDRKSVIANLTKLEEKGFISDTGRRVGRTGQIKVYSLSVPKTEPSQKRNDSEFSAKSPKNGTRNLSEPVKSEAKASSQRVFDHWNVVAKAAGYHTARVLDNSRSQTLHRRVKEHGEDVLIDAINRAGRASWLKGKGRDSNWRPDFDWFLTPAALRKLLEGSYGQEEEAKPAASAAERALQAEQRAAFYTKIGRDEDAAESLRQAARLRGTIPAEPIGSIALRIVGGMAG